MIVVAGRSAASRAATSRATARPSRLSGGSARPHQRRPVHVVGAWRTSQMSWAALIRRAPAAGSRRIARPATRNHASSAVVDEALVGDPEHVAERAAEGVHRHDPEPDLVADDDGRTVVGGEGARRASTGPSTAAMTSGSGPSSEQADPERQAVEEDRRPGGDRPDRRRRGRDPARPSPRSAGRSRRCIAIRSSSSASPGSAVATYVTGPSPASADARSRPNRALAAPRPAEDHDQRPAHRQQHRDDEHRGERSSR